MKKLVLLLLSSLPAYGILQQTEITDLLRVPQTILSKNSTRVWVPRDVSGKQMLLVEGNFKSDAGTEVEINNKTKIASNVTKKVSFLPVDNLGASFDLSNPSPASPYFIEEIFSVPFDQSLHQTERSFQSRDLIPAGKVYALAEKSAASFQVISKRNIAVPIDFMIVKLPATKRTCAKIYVSASGNLLGFLESKGELTSYLIRVKKNISSVEIVNGCGFPVSIKKFTAYQLDGAYSEALEAEAAYGFEEVNTPAVVIEPKNKSEKFDLATPTGAYVGLIVETHKPNAKLTIEANENKQRYYELFDKPDTHFRIVAAAPSAKRIQIFNESDAAVTIHKLFVINKFPAHLTYPFYDKENFDLVRLRPKDGMVAVYIADEVIKICRFIEAKAGKEALLELEAIRSQALKLKGVAKEQADLSESTLEELKKLRAEIVKAKKLIEFLSSIEEFEFFPVQLGKLKEFIDSKTFK